MSQFTFGNIDETTTDGYDLAAFLEAFEAAINSQHEGSTAPVYAIQGMIWRDTSASPQLIKIYDGTQWITTGELNTTSHTYRPYNNGNVLGDLAGYGIGDGLEISSTNIRIKLNGSSLARSSDGLSIAAKGIGVSHFADQIDGSLLTWNTAGEAALLVPGTAGQILTSGGPGAVPSWQTASGGDVKLIGSVNLSGLVTSTVAFDPTLYSSILVRFNDLSTTYAQADIKFKPVIGNTVVDWSGGNVWQNSAGSSPTAVKDTEYSVGSSLSFLTHENPYGISGEFWFNNINGSNTYRTGRGTAYNAAYHDAQEMYTYHNSGGAVTGMNISYSGTGAFGPNAAMSIYGYRK